MNGRILYLKTSAARISAFFRSVILQRVHPTVDIPDYRDIEEKITLFMEREDLLSRLEEWKQPRTQDRKDFLDQRLGQVERELGKIDLFKL